MGNSTQAYTLASLRDLLRRAEVPNEVETIDRVEYAWSTELNDVTIPPAQARPYDWCAVVRVGGAPTGDAADPPPRAPPRPSSSSLRSLGSASK